MISESAFNIKSAFDSKSDIGSLGSENDISFSDKCSYITDIHIYEILFFTHTVRVSTLQSQHVHVFFLLFVGTVKS